MEKALIEQFMLLNKTTQETHEHLKSLQANLEGIHQELRQINSNIETINEHFI